MHKKFLLILTLGAVSTALCGEESLTALIKSRYGAKIHSLKIVIPHKDSRKEGVTINPPFSLEKNTGLAINPPFSLEKNTGVTINPPFSLEKNTDVEEWSFLNPKASEVGSWTPQEDQQNPLESL